MELTIDEINNLVKNNETLINKNNRIEEELNQTKLLLEGKLSVEMITNYDLISSLTDTQLVTFMIAIADEMTLRNIPKAETYAALKSKNKDLSEQIKKLQKTIFEYFGEKVALEKDRDIYYKTLEEIKTLCNKGAGVYTNAKVVGLINEVLK